VCRNSGARGPLLHEYQVRFLEDLLDSTEEERRRVAVDDAVIEGQAQPHLGAHDDLTVARDRLRRDPADTEDRALGRIDDRGKGVDAGLSKVGDAERAAGDLVD